jgi:S1-C subfamily serine protease
MELPADTPLPSNVPQELFAANLGTHYQLIPLGNGRYGARLSRTARTNTPAGVLRLERGDMITRLDGEPIRSENDLVRHYSSTGVDFIDIRTGQARTGNLQLPEVLSASGG